MTTRPLPEMAPAKLAASDRLKARVALFSTSPDSEPVSPPSPIRNVPAEIVVPPACPASPVMTEIPAGLDQWACARNVAAQQQVRLRLERSSAGTDRDSPAREHHTVVAQRSPVEGQHARLCAQLVVRRDRQHATLELGAAAMGIGAARRQRTVAPLDQLAGARDVACKLLPKPLVSNVPPAGPSVTNRVEVEAREVAQGTAVEIQLIAAP